MGQPISEAHQRRKEAREKAGFKTYRDASKKVGYCESYLRSIERNGGCPYLTARKLSRWFNCPISYFL